MKLVLHSSIILLAVISAACSPKYQLEKNLSQGVNVPKYPYAAPFQCVAAPKERYSNQAVQAFKKAEKQRKSPDVSVEDKIAAYQKADKLGHPEALQAILSVYYENNQPIIRHVARRSNVDPFSMYGMIRGSNEMETVIVKNKYDQEIEEIRLKIAGQQKNNDHLVSLAQMKLKGTGGVQKDEKRAFDYLMYASLKGNVNAQEQLGDYYFYQLGEYEKGVKALQCASSQGSATAYQQLAVGATVFEENPPKALDYQIKAGDKGSLKSVALLRSVFRDGTMGYEKDKELADCFNQFILEFSINPKSIYGLEMACPLPEHPELKYGDDPLTPEKRADIAKIERKFNPNKAVTDDEKYVLQQNREKKLLSSKQRKGRERSKPSRF